jgi:hypothetical protein
MPSAAGRFDTTAAAARHAAAWLREAWGDGEGKAEFVVEALALGHLCDILAGEKVSPGARAIACADPDPAWTEAHLATSLLAAAAVLGTGGPIGRSALAYLSALDEAAEHLPETEPNSGLLQLALHGCVKRDGVFPAAFVPVRPEPPTLLLHDVAAIEAASLFGTVPVRSGAASGLLLEGAAVAAFRTYDLGLGMRILRARRYLDERRSPGLDMAFDFLRLAFAADGSFGDLDSAISGLAAAGSPCPALRLKLPLTLQALWTLAELEDPRFRLVKAALADIPFQYGRRRVDAVQWAD